MPRPSQNDDAVKLDVIIALLAQLVAATTKRDEVLTLAAAGLGATEIARVLDMKRSAVSMRLTRGKARGSE